MRPLVLPLLLAASLALQAQLPADRFHAAEQQYAAHRADGTTWDDGTPEAAQALDAMWSAVIAQSNDYLLTHPGVEASYLEANLEALTPVIDARFGNGLSASVIKLDHNLYAVAFNDGAAGIVFVLRPHGGAPIAWRIDETSAQGKDTGNLLRAWRSSQADDKCRDRQPEREWSTCGPLVSSVGVLPRSRAGAPRFYVDANYSRDAGASVEDQISVWEWEGSSPALLWIHTYVDHLDATRPVAVHGTTLSFGEQTEFKTFSSFASGDARQLLHEVAVTPETVKDLGARSLYPELDALDHLIDTIQKKRPLLALADPLALPPFISAVHGTRLAGLEDWSVMRQSDGRESLCVLIDDLSPWMFTLTKRNANPYFVTGAHEGLGKSRSCAKKGALRKPYSPAQ